MESSGGRDPNMDADSNTTKITTIISIGDSDSSLSLSLTPPSLGDGKKDEQNTLVQSEDSISEHLSSAATSIENDRSLNEIEIENVPNYPSEVEALEESNNDNIDFSNSPSQEELDDAIKISLDSNTERKVKSILEEILNNEQFISDSESFSKKSLEDSFDIFANLDLEDKSITERLINQVSNVSTFGPDEKVDNAYKQVQDLEELLDIKEQTIIALTSELESLREAVSNPSTISLGTSTEYKQLHEDYQNKFVEYNLALQQKDDLILQLTESLQQSIKNREELKTQVEHFKNELEHLHQQLETTSRMILENESRTKSPESQLPDKIPKDISLNLGITNFEFECSKLEETLGENQLRLFNDVKATIHKYIDEKLIESKNDNEKVVTQLKASMQKEKERLEIEINRLKDALEAMKNGNEEIAEFKQEVEVKHQREMEDLRRYFEQKCTELEKNYSEEIFSQQSRKRSDSVTSSDNEIPLDIPNRPGPGGDAPSSLDTYRVDYTKRALQNLSKSDLTKLREDFRKLTGIFEKFEIESCSDEDLLRLKEELGEFDVKNLFKIEMEAFRNEMKNKYNAELEILNQDYENRVDMLRVQQEDKLNATREKYLEEIDMLKEILNKTNKSLEYGGSMQEVGNSGDFEINEVIQSYERRLQEQVTMAKIDIIAALENQIQRLAENEGSEEEWPQELLTLKERFTLKFEKKIAEMEREHEEEVARLKEDHIRSLNGALERARRRSLRDGDSLPLQDVKLIEERDNFKKQSGLLRKLLGELLKYFTQCEDEVNNTLVEELMRQAAEKNFTDIERELNESSSSFSGSSASTPAVKRVHLAPNFKDLMGIVENSSESTTEFSLDLRNELESCLDKLRSEANALLALSVDVSKKSSEPQEVEEDRVGSLKRKLIEEAELRMGVAEEAEQLRRAAETAERERAGLEAQVGELVERLNVTQAELERARGKIGELLEQREVVSEGYGGGVFGGEHEEESAAAAFNELQEKARTILVGSRNHDPALLHLVEDLVGVGERILEEYDATKKDLQQQIDVAHKKYKQTCKFLEEQAVDREMERDDSQKQLLALRDQLKSLDRDRANYANITEEVEHLEAQLKETASSLKSREDRLKEVESEKDEAVEKIFFLRDVIRELEAQLKAKTETEAELRNLISDLEVVITQQTAEAAGEGESEDVEGSETRRYRERVRSLEAEVQKLRLGQELVGNEGALREFRNQLFEIEATIERKTKELEDQSSIVSTTTCSSPSEDMSVRDVVRPKTPTGLNVNDCEIPLQQLARLKEKLVRHSRAEDAALKRIRDLEMQVYNLQTSNEEHKTERDILKKEISDQLVLISSLQIRLEDQRIRAEHIERQTNSSLENKIYELQREVSELQESLQLKNKTIENLNSLLEDVRRKMEDKEMESGAASEDEMIVTMQKEIEHLRNQNDLLHKRLNTGVDIIPNLVENIISDKNSDIESLRQKLECAEKQLEMYSSLNLDKSQVMALQSLRNSGTSLSEVMSIIELSSPDQARRMADTEENSDIINFIKRKATKNDTLLPSEEISSIENLNQNYTSMTPMGKKNSTEVKSAEKRVHFDLANKKNQTEVLIAELEKLREELTKKDEVIKDLNEKLKTLKHLESNIDIVQAKLEETQYTLEGVEKEMEDMEEKEKDLRMELVQKNMYLEEQQKELNLLKDDCVRKDEMYLTLAKEAKSLRKDKEILEGDLQRIMEEKNEAIQELDKKVAVLQRKGEDFNLESRLRENEEQCQSLKIRLENFSKEIENKNEYIEKLESDKGELQEMIKVEIGNNEKLRKNMENMLRENEEKLRRTKEQIGVLESEKVELESEIRELQGEIMENERELGVLRRGSVEYEEKLRGLERELEELRKRDVAGLEKKVLQLQLEKSSKMDEVDELRDKLEGLKEELGRFQDLVAEKDRIIARFKNDSEQLQGSLIAIQAKMQENGNVVDLSKKLRDEQMKNSDLIEEIQIMKAQMMSYNALDKDPLVASIEEITGKMRQELDYSAEIDSNIINATEDIENADSKLESKYVELKEKCKSYQKSNRLLKEELEKKKIEMDTLQLEDANLLEQLRIQLESATENEMELEAAAESWKKRCEILEIEVSKLSNANSKSESTEYKNLPSKERQEVAKLREGVAALNMEVERLREETRGLKKGRKELENDLKYNKDMLEVKKREVDGLEKKVFEGVKREEELKEKLRNCEEKLKQKDKEVENSRMLIDDMERDRKDMKLQMDMLNGKLREMDREASKRTTAPSSNVTTADQLMSKIEELNLAVKNDKQTMDLIIRLTNDNTNLKSKIIELEKQGSHNVPYENQVNRSNYLFAKCLRVESYRKALIWQKRYLVYLIGSYQHTTDLGPLEKFQNGQKRLRFSGIRKFRSSAYTIIAIIRMKSIVRRWHSGPRLAENAANSGYKNIPGGSRNSQTSEPYSGPGNFKVGQPVSRQLFSPSSRSGNVLATNFENIDARSGFERRTPDIPWSGDSPPCRDGSRGKTRLSSNLTLLKAPHLLSQYAERYGKIEENLEALLKTNTST